MSGCAGGSDRAVVEGFGIEAVGLDKLPQRDVKFLQDLQAGPVLQKSQARKLSRGPGPVQTLRKDSFAGWSTGGRAVRRLTSLRRFSASSLRQRGWHHRNPDAQRSRVFFPTSPAAKGHPGNHPGAAGIEGLRNWARFWGLTGYNSRKSTFISA